VAQARAQAVADRLEALGVRDIEIRSETPAVSPQDPSALWFAAVRPLGLAGAQATEAEAGLDEVAP
jgi:isopropylmalate/homocitrate/citramalate synthase